MKVALITDLHLGVHRSSDVYLQSQKRFFFEQFIPYLEDNNINTVIIPGDVFDTRHSINVKALNFAYELFEKLRKYSIYIVIGNHDIFFTNTTDTTSLVFLNKFDNIELIKETTIIKNFGAVSKDILFVPWQTNPDEFTNYILEENPKADVCIGHFDIAGFQMVKNHVSENGYTPKLFSNFKLTFSGHFHIRSVDKKKGTEIIYLGTPYAMDRNDASEPKGFCVLNLDNLEYEFVENEVSFKYVEVKYPQNLDETTIKGNVVNLTVEWDENFEEKKYNEFMEELTKLAPLDIREHHISNFVDMSEIKSLEDLDATKDMKQLLIGSVDEILSEHEKLDKIKNIVVELYEETK